MKPISLEKGLGHDKMSITLQIQPTAVLWTEDVLKMAATAIRLIAQGQQHLLQQLYSGENLLNQGELI